MRVTKWPANAVATVIVGLSSISVGALLTAKTFTAPRCFAVAYSKVIGSPVPEWSWPMARHYLLQSPWVPFTVVSLAAWMLAVFVVHRQARVSFAIAFRSVAHSYFLLALLVLPAVWWTDIPGTGLFMDRHYHDGRGEFLWGFAKGRYLATVAIVTGTGLLWRRLRTLRRA